MGNVFTVSAEGKVFDVTSEMVYNERDSRNTKYPDYYSNENIIIKLSWC